MLYVVEFERFVNAPVNGTLTYDDVIERYYEACPSLFAFSYFFQARAYAQNNAFINCQSAADDLTISKEVTVETVTTECIYDYWEQRDLYAADPCCNITYV